MTKLYNVEQHKFASSVPLKIESEHYIAYVHGLEEALDEVHSYDIECTLENLFRIFIDNKATQHVYLFLDDNGDITSSIKISIWK